MIELTLQDGDRDLTVVIEKMDAYAAESWMIRAGLLLGREVLEAKDMKDLQSLIRSLCQVNYEDAKPLLDELLACCSVKSGKLTKRLPSPGLIESPITLLRLRVEALKTNFGFLFTGESLSSLAGQVLPPTVKP